MKRITKEKIKEYCSIETVKKQTIFIFVILLLSVILYFSPTIRLEIAQSIRLEKYIIGELWFGLILIGVGLLIFLKSMVQYFTADSILKR